MRNKLEDLINAHKPDRFFKRAQIKNFGEREKLDIEGAEIYVRNFEWIISSDAVDYDDEYMDPETTLPQFAIDAKNGVPIMINHNYSPLNCGRSTDGTFDDSQNIVTATGYIQEGLIDVNSDDVIARLLAGTSPEASVGYLGETVCNYDNTPMHWFWGDCEYGHYRGQKILLDSDGNETVEVDEAVETFTIYGKIIDGRLLEFSPVWRACNQDAQLIRSVRSLYKAGDIDDEHIKGLSHRLSYDFKSMLGGRKTFTRRHNNRRKTMATENTVPQEEYDDVMADLQDAQDRIKELEKRPKIKEVEDQINTLNTELEAKDAEVATLKEQVAELEASTSDLDLGLKLLRQDVLDAYADEQGLNKWGRENDEKYSDLKKSLESMESIGGLIRRRKRFDTSATATDERRTTRKSHTIGDEYESNVVPVPGTPGEGAYRE